MVAGTDTLFAALCGQLTAQFSVLSRKLESTKCIGTNEDFILNLEEGIRHHIKLIE